MQKYICTVCGYIYDPLKATLWGQLLQEQLLTIFQTIGAAPLRGRQSDFETYEG